MCYHAPIMKKLLLLPLVALFGTQPLWAAVSIGEQYSHRSKPVAIAVLEPVNKTGDAALLSADVKKAFEEKLAARKTPKFEVTSDPAAAELSVSVEVVESLFLEHDPIDKMIGIGGTAWDAANVEHYSRLVAVYKVTDVKSDRVIWTDKLMATVTDKTMTKDEGRAKVTARAAEIFIREAFGKKRK